MHVSDFCLFPLKIIYYFSVCKCAPSADPKVVVHGAWRRLQTHRHWPQLQHVTPALPICKQCKCWSCSYAAWYDQSNSCPGEETWRQTVKTQAVFSILLSCIAEMFRSVTVILVTVIFKLYWRIWLHSKCININGPLGPRPLSTWHV